MVQNPKFLNFPLQSIVTLEFSNIIFFSANTTEACLQHEITRLTSENFDLREKIENLNDNIRRLKKMLKTYMKRIEDSGENPRDLDSVNETNYEQVI